MCTYTYLLTYSTVQSPPWAANRFAASKEIPRISRNPKVHYHTHKRPPPVSILDQANPVHIPASHLLEIHPNIIHPSTPRPPQWSPSHRFPHQDPIHPPLLTHTNVYVYRNFITDCRSWILAFVLGPTYLFFEVSRSAVGPTQSLIWGPRLKGRSVKLNTLLVPLLRMNEDTFQFPLIPSWRVKRKHVLYLWNRLYSKIWTINLLAPKLFF